jgi:hypothetical protein
MIFDILKIASPPQTQNRSLAEASAPSLRSQTGGEPEAEKAAHPTIFLKLCLQ